MDLNKQTLASFHFVQGSLTHSTTIATNGPTFKLSLAIDSVPLKAIFSIFKAYFQ